MIVSPNGEDRTVAEADEDEDEDEEAAVEKPTGARPPVFEVSEVEFSAMECGSVAKVPKTDG